MAGDAAKCGDARAEAAAMRRAKTAQRNIVVAYACAVCMAALNVLAARVVSILPAK